MLDLEGIKSAISENLTDTEKRRLADWLASHINVNAVEAFFFGDHTEK